jgi:superfamily II DNA or RNA helicase
MIKFFVGPDSVRVESRFADAEWLSEYMALYPKNVYFTLKYATVSCKLCKGLMVYKGKSGWYCRRCNMMQKGWDGSERFFNLRTRSFSTGFWPHIRRTLKLEKRRYTVVDTRIPLERVTSVVLSTETLYKDQIVALNKWLKWGGRGIVWCAPGFGKTELAMGAIKVLYDRHLIKSALFVCSGLDAMVQTKERMKKQLKLPTGTITVTNIQALAQALRKKDISTIRYIQNLDFIIIDESHHQRASEFRKLVSLFRGPYRLGISASPFHEYKKADLHSMRSDDAVVLKLLGPVVSRFSASSLIEKDRLAKPIIFLYPLPEVETFGDLTWMQTRKLMLVENTAMHSVIARFVATAAAAEEQSLVVAGGIKKLAFNCWKALDKKGVNVKFLHGGVDKGYRNWTRKQLIKGRIDAICATTIYDEAVDLPNLRLLALAYGGLSSIKIEQRVGRDLRKKQGKNVALVLDFVCTSNRHLKKHSYARIKHWMKERAFDFCLVGEHSPYVKRLFRNRAKFLDDLPGVDFFRSLKDGANNKGTQGLVEKEAARKRNFRRIPSRPSDHSRTHNIQRTATNE